MLTRIQRHRRQENRQAWTAMVLTLGALGMVLAHPTPAQSQRKASANPQVNIARLASPLKEPVKINADGLLWGCSENTCTSDETSSRPTPQQCAALARELKTKIAVYAKGSQRLTRPELATCNAALVARPVTGQTPRTVSTAAKPATQRIETRRGGQGTVEAESVGKKPAAPGQQAAKPAPRLSPSAQRAPVVVAPTSTAAQQAAQQAARQAVGRPVPGSDDSDELITAPSAIEERGAGTFVLYARSPQALSFHGTYEGTYRFPPAFPIDEDYPMARFEGDTLRLTGLQHTGLDNAFERRFPNRGSGPPDYLYERDPSGYFVEVPLNFTNIPEQAEALEISCRFGALPARRRAVGRGPFSDANLTGLASGVFYIRDQESDGDWSLTQVARMPINLEYMARVTDIKTVGCSVQVYAVRNTGIGRDILSLARAIDRSNPDRVIGFPGSTRTPSVIEVRADVEQ